MDAKPIISSFRTVIKQLFLFLVFAFIFTATGFAQDINKQLLDAVKENNYELITKLISDGANVNTQDTNNASVLMWATYKGDLKTVKYLVSKNADFLKKGIIYTNAEKTSYYGNILGITAGENKPDLLEYFLKDCKINANDREYNTETKKDDGWTALHWAASFGYDTIIKILLDNKADIDAVYETDNTTAIIYAAQNQKYNTVKYLLENNANTNIRNKNGWSLLHYLAREGRTELFKLVLEKQKDINVQTKKGFTPLMLAVFNNNLEICFLLIKNNADIKIKDSNSYTAIDYAKEQGNTKIVMLLKKPEKYKSLSDINNVTTWEDLNKQFLSYYNKGNYERAKLFAEKAKTQAEKEFGKNHPNYATACNNLAALYKDMGYYKKALPLYIEAKEIDKKFLGKDHSHYAADCNNLALLYQDIGSYEKALPLYIEAKEIDKKVLGKDHPDYAMSCNNLAYIYQEMGNYKKALPLCIEVRKIIEKVLGKDHPDYATICNNLAVLYNDMDNYEKALPLYLEAKEIRSKVLGKDHPDYAMSCNNLAGLYDDMGNYEKALPLYIEAKEIRLKVLGKDHPDYAMSCNNLAALYEDIGNYKKALGLYMEAKEIIKKVLGENHFDYATVCNNLAILYQNMGNYRKALDISKKGISMINKNIGKNLSFLSEKEREAYFNMNSGDFEGFNSLVLQAKEQFPDITTTVFNNTVRNKGILLKSSTAMRTAILNSKDTVLINKYNRWISLNKEIVKLYSTPIAKRKKDPKQLEAQANILERDLVKNSQEFSAFTQTLKIGWEDVQKALKSNEVAIEFVHFRLYDKKWTDSTIYCALIVTPDSKYPEMIPLFEEKQLEKIIGKFGGNNYSYINGIYGKNSEVNTQLYNLIWAPIDSVLNTSVSVSQRHTDTKLKIYLSPDGLLHKISFPAIAKEQNVYLCDAYDIEVKSTTGKIASKGVAQSNTLANATLFGGITYDTDSTTQKIWNYLAGTKTETQEIDKILKEGKVNVNYFSNTSATEEEFKLMASNSNILHIATHGFFYPNPKEVQKEKKVEYGDVVFRGGNRGFGVYRFVYNPNPLMRSGLVFAGANNVWNLENISDSIDDGVLTAQEVVSIDMRKTNLVVMSACETGLGDIKGSEGVYGLQRAFKMAGVRYEIMSLWQVPDKETVAFMTSFYQKLMKQKTVKQAFAETQHEMRQKYDPYFWAAFVLIE